MKLLGLLQMLELKLNIETFSSILQPIYFKYFILLAIFLILIYRFSSTSTNSTPPSPPKLPIIGNLHQLGSHLPRSLKTLSERHGPLMLLHFGSKPVLVVSSDEAAREIMKTHDIIFSNRPQSTFFKTVCYNYKDIASASYGEYWRQLKSICVLNLLSKKRVRSYRAVREEETNYMINNILKHSSSISTSRVLDLSEILLTLTNDVICRVAMGRKYSDDPDQGKMFTELSGDLSDLISRIHIGDYIPWLAWFGRLNGLDAKLDNLAERFDDFLETVIREHMDDALIKNDDQKDLVDIFLSLQKERPDNSPIDRVSIKATIMDVFVAGSDTTFTTLEWTMSELLRHPRVMEKLQKEIRGIVGKKTDITEDDLVGMNYLRAVIKETLRLHPAVPLLLPRFSSQDVKIHGYDIKANTQVIVNAWQIGRDPKSYRNSEEYEPSRFLNSVIDYQGNDFHYIPFGSGRRGCPGIHFSNAIEEITLANLLHKFDWLLPDGAKGEDLDMTESTTASVRRKYPLKVVAILYSG